MTRLSCTGQVVLRIGLCFTGCSTVFGLRRDFEQDGFLPEREVGCLDAPPRIPCGSTIAERINSSLIYAVSRRTLRD